ncbi:MAG: hypothetical protein WC544_04330 [Patescibacteria group bacterium]
MHKGMTPDEICNACGAANGVEPFHEDGKGTFRPCDTCPVSLAKSDPARQNVPYQPPA